MIRSISFYLQVFSLSVLLALSQSAYVRGFEPVTTDNSFNAWGFLNARYNISQRWNLTGLVFVRGANDFSQWQQWYVRPSLGYAVNSSVEVGVGYTYAQMFPYGNQPAPLAFTENNIFQQLILRQKAGKVGLMHRVRLEQRFVDHVERSLESGPYIDGIDYMNRFRFRIDGMIPVALEERLFISLYDEVFVHLQDVMLPDVFDQNRAYIGLGYQMNKKLRMEFGVLHHYLRKRDGVRFESNPTMQMGVGLQLGPVKRKTPAFEPKRAI